MSTATDRRGWLRRSRSRPSLSSRLLAFAPPARAWLGLAVAGALLGSALALLQAGILSLIVTAVFQHGSGLRGIVAGLAAVILVAACRGGALLGAEMFGQLAASRVKQAVRDRLIRAFLERGPLGLQAERTGELATMLGEGVEALDEYLRSYLVLVAVMVVGPLLVLGAYAVVDPLSALALLIIAPFLPILMVLIGLRTRDLMDRRWTELGRMSAHFLDMLQGLPTLKVFGQSSAQADQIELISRRYGRSTMDVLKVAFQSSLILDLSTTMGVALVAIEVGARLLFRMIGFEQALFVLLLAPEFFLPFRQFAAGRHARLSADSAAARIFQIIGSPPLERAALPVPGRGDILLQNISYTPPGRIDEVLREVDLRIAEGRVTALTGPSGSGKTTIANLLVGFLVPDQGCLLVGGVELADATSESWRRRVSLVSQQPHLFGGSVADNIRLGNPKATPEEVAAAARDACADEFIRSLADEYDTEVGEHGARLSGGQRQRLALARAYLQDRPIMVLDEPTVHLDAALAERVWEGLRRRAAGRTVLLITHDPDLAAQADDGIRLEEGRVVQESAV